MAPKKENTSWGGRVACTTPHCSGLCFPAQNAEGKCGDGSFPAYSTEEADASAKMEQIFAASSQLYKYGKGNQDWGFLTETATSADPAPTGAETPNLDAVYYLDDVSSWSGITLPSNVQFSMLEDIEGGPLITRARVTGYGPTGVYTGGTGTIGAAPSSPFHLGDSWGYCQGSFCMQDLRQDVTSKMASDLEHGRITWNHTPCADGRSRHSDASLITDEKRGGFVTYTENPHQEEFGSVKCMSATPVRDCTYTRGRGWAGYCRAAYDHETFTPVGEFQTVQATETMALEGEGPRDEVAYTEGLRAANQLDFIADDADSIFLGYWWEEADPQYTDYADGNGYAKRVFAVENEDLGITIEYIDEENLNVTHTPLEISGLRRKSGAPEGEVLTPSSLLAEVAAYFYPLMTLDSPIVEKQVLYNKVSQEAIKGRNLFNILSPAESEMIVLQQHTGSFNTQANITSNTESTY